MASFSEDQVDLCLGELVQDVAEDSISAAEAAASWAQASAEPDRPGQGEDSPQADFPVNDSSSASYARQTSQRAADPDADAPQLLEASEAGLSVQAGAFLQADDTLPDTEQSAGDFAAQQPTQDTSPRASADVLVELPASAAETATDASDAPTQADRTAATLSKELRKLQAESAVLQEHSRRLQEKAAVIQQQRTSVDQGKQGQEGFRRQSSEQSESEAMPYSGGIEGDKEGAYQYSSDTSLPVQDGGLQWSIGGVPLQQQLRMLTSDNGMGMDEQAAEQGRSSGGSDAPQGLQWGTGPGPAPVSPTKKKSLSGAKAAKDAQATGINSVGALHDARSKQVPQNPLRTRKASVGQAANPVIRQQSISHQAQAKQGRHFADTLRKHGQQQGGASDGSPQALSPDPQQEPFYPNRVLADLYGSSLASSKSEPNGLYAQGTPKGGYPMQAVAGPPKAASVHEMDMSPPQPAGTKRRSKAGRNPTSAPGPYSQNWGHPGAPFMGMTGGPGMQAGTMQAGQGMMGGMYNPQAMAHLPQLAQPQMGLNMMGYGQPMGPQQAFGSVNPAQGAGTGMLQGKASRRNLGMTRQAGSALKVPAGNPMMGAQPMQQGNFTDALRQMPYGGSPMGTIPAFPMQYAPQHGAFAGQPQMMPGQYGALPPVGYPAMLNAMQSGPHGGMHGGMHMSSMQNTSRQHRKARMPAGQTNYMQQGGAPYAAALPMAHAAHQPAGYHPQGMQGMNYPAMQQHADAVQQFQMQQYQQMEASVMQQVQQKQEHALLKYGNFENSQYRQQDMQSRPEFRTY